VSLSGAGLQRSLASGIHDKLVAFVKQKSFLRLSELAILQWILLLLIRAKTVWTLFLSYKTFKQFEKPSYVDFELSFMNFGYLV
jgi:hypothetical protein